MIRRIEIPQDGINIAQVIAKKHPQAKMVNCLVEHHVDGELAPILVTIDPQTWQIDVPNDDWQPVVAGGVIVALERSFGVPLKRGRGYHQVTDTVFTDNL